MNVLRRHSSRGFAPNPPTTSPGFLRGVRVTALFRDSRSADASPEALALIMQPPMRPVSRMMRGETNVGRGGGRGFRTSFPHLRVIVAESVFSFCLKSHFAEWRSRTLRRYNPFQPISIRSQDAVVEVLSLSRSTLTVTAASKKTATHDVKFAISISK